ncbi:hypothetical protein [Nesterenkonia aerolata]|uniref:Uncharacterized protein n=1 Tax=Nesterenkonia aerolata TaxID=3074079 RepID=A0ABU2DV64_9MICC|nr:hypothetical protein [Nesterenkonia sp. LY-0111]MDR8020364.1 hypothetical protein [Nesterenkonia sp. LY-0111]
MDYLIDLLKILHFIGLAFVLGGAIIQGRPKPPRERRALNKGVLHGTYLMLISGVLLVGIYETYADSPELNHIKIGVKTLVLVAIWAIAFFHRKRVPVPGWVLGSIAGLSVVNIVLAVMW